MDSLSAFFAISNNLDHWLLIDVSLNFGVIHDFGYFHSRMDFRASKPPRVYPIARNLTHNATSRSWEQRITGRNGFVLDILRYCRYCEFMYSLHYRS